MSEPAPKAGPVSRILRRLAPKSVDVPVLARLFKDYWRRFAWRYLIALALMLVVAGATAGSAWMMRDVVNVVFIGRNAGMMAAVSGAIVALYTARGVASYFQEVILARVGARVIADVQRKLFNSVLEQDIGFFSRMGASDLVARLTHNARAANNALQTVTQSLGRDLFTLIGLFAVMLMQDVILTGIVLLGAPLLFLIVSQLLKRGRKLFGREVFYISGVIGTMQEAAQGIRVVKSFRLESILRARMDNAVREVERVTNRISAVTAATAPLVDILGGFAVASVILYGGWRITYAGATPGEFFAFIAALLMASEPIRKLTRLNVTLAAASVGVRMMYDLIDAKPVVRDAPDATPLKVAGGAVALTNVTFGYDPERPVLRDLTLYAAPGQTTALVGLSGGGKSTIINLALRFWDPQQGRVEIDGQELSRVTAESIYEQTALVNQDVFLFEGSVRDNILRGRPDASEAEIVAAAKAAAAHDFIMALPNGYAAQVGALGGDLSGGQRQRISIARAFLKDAPILLLDEPTSALDAESDAAIQLALARLMKGRTTIIIAHRLATIVSADMIYVIEDGGVAERGAHAELLRMDGIYARLHAMQYATL